MDTSDTLTPQLLEKVAERFRALADEIRIRILLRLGEGECNVGLLSHDLNIAQPTISKHLAVLRRTGLVDQRRVGTQAIYRVRDESTFALCEVVYEGVLRHIGEEHNALGFSASVQSNEPVQAGQPTHLQE